jgi:hypothetical protein
MKILAVFNTPGMTSGQYDQCIRELEKAGLGKPDGRISHVCGVNDESFFVTDVWESEEKFAKFGEQLMPILESIGVNVSPPQTFPFYHSIEG